MRGDKGATLYRNEIEAFKAKWPAHGLPDNLWRLHCEFATNGDLIDVTAYARNGRQLNTHNFDGPARVGRGGECRARV
ncbi:hypothetical protein, partial [Tepidimonas sp.]|uniref:hypothetical protein n=1 Tax=Tepidimonas sp. TaxID=2002775 RepID=UPI0039190083